MHAFCIVFEIGTTKRKCNNIMKHYLYKLIVTMKEKKLGASFGKWDMHFVLYMLSFVLVSGIL
jgi:hypothetical protein